MHGQELLEQLGSWKAFSECNSASLREPDSQ